MTHPRIIPAADSVERLEALQQSLTSHPDTATVLLATLREALEAWGFVRRVLRDPDLDATALTLATFHIVPAYPHLQKGVVGTGFADPSEVSEVIGLIQSARVHT